MKSIIGLLFSGAQKNVMAARRKFLRFFPKGFQDNKYLNWERNYKWNAHLLWNETLHQQAFKKLLKNGEYQEICRRAIFIESKTNLLFSFEKMSLRDSLKPLNNAEIFAHALYNNIYGQENLQKRFEDFNYVLAKLAENQPRMNTWPLQTVFAFIARPEENIFLKPMVTKKAALAYDYPFNYKSRVNWDTYYSLLNFAALIKKQNRDLKPLDMIDLQSFIWVLGSDEYL